MTVNLKSFCCTSRSPAGCHRKNLFHLQCFFSDTQVPRNTFWAMQKAAWCKKYYEHVRELFIPLLRTVLHSYIGHPKNTRNLTSCEVILWVLSSCFNLVLPKFSVEISGPKYVLPNVKVVGVSIRAKYVIQFFSLCLKSLHSGLILIIDSIGE